jgi:hypothetical protein
MEEEHKVELPRHLKIDGLSLGTCTIENSGILKSIEILEDGTLKAIVEEEKKDA